MDLQYTKKVQVKKFEERRSVLRRSKVHAE